MWWVGYSAMVLGIVVAVLQITGDRNGRLLVFAFGIGAALFLLLAHAASAPYKQIGWAATVVYVGLMFVPALRDDSAATLAQDKATAPSRSSTVDAPGATEPPPGSASASTGTAPSTTTIAPSAAAAAEDGVQPYYFGMSNDGASIHSTTKCGTMGHSAFSGVCFIGKERARLSWQGIPNAEEYRFIEGQTGVMDGCGQGEWQLTFTVSSWTPVGSQKIKASGPSTALRIPIPKGASGVFYVDIDPLAAGPRGDVYCPAIREFRLTVG
jgi:hypothetical protein